MKKLLQTFGFILLTSIGFSQGSFGDIQGQLFEQRDKDIPAAYAKVWVERGETKFGTLTDENGRFIINSIPTGIYPLKVSYMSDTLGYEILTNVQVGGIDYLGRVNFYEDVTLIDEFKVVRRIEDRLIEHGDVGIRRISALDIAKSAVKTDMKSIIMSRNSDIKMNEQGEMMIRGSRPNDLVYYIDGVKMGQVKNVPSSAIGSITVYTNAIPAQYGDTNGGVIIMETKSYYDLWRAWKMSKGE